MTCTTRLVLPAHPHPEPRDVPRPQAELEDAIEEVLVTPGDEADCAVREDQGITTVERNSPLKRIVVRIEVSDTGSGIPAREITQGKLFSESRRVLNHFSSNFPSTRSL